MTQLIELMARLDADERRVVIDAMGNRIPDRVPTDLGPAALLVSPVVDALKRVWGDRVVGSIDRGQVLAVEGFVLDRDLLERLASEDVSVNDLIGAVTSLGYVWKTHEHDRSTPA
ncbi:MAG: hypothetical protein WD269_02455 [Acidimicrobiia bacterium]